MRKHSVFHVVGGGFPKRNSVPEKPNISEELCSWSFSSGQIVCRTYSEMRLFIFNPRTIIAVEIGALNQKHYQTYGIRRIQGLTTSNPLRPFCSPIILVWRLLSG